MTDSKGRRWTYVKVEAASGSLHIVGPMPDSEPGAGASGGRDRATQLQRELQHSAGEFSGPGAWARHKLGVIASTRRRTSTLRRWHERYNGDAAGFIRVLTPNAHVQSNIEPPSSYPKSNT